MDDIRRPSELFDRFKNALREKDGPFIVVAEELTVLVAVNGLSMKILLTVDEVDLHPRRWDGSDLDDERMVGIVDDKVHSGKPDNLVQLMPPFVDLPVPGSEDPDLLASFVDPLRKIPADAGEFVLGKERGHFLRNVENLRLFHGSSDALLNSEWITKIIDPGRIFKFCLSFVLKVCQSFQQFKSPFENL